MLTFSLKKEWFEKIARGEKRVEYREVKPYWTARLSPVGNYPKVGHEKNFLPIFNRYLPCPCIFVLGYSRKKINAVINKIEIVNGKNTDLQIDAPVYAIYFKIEK